MLRVAGTPVDVICTKFPELKRDSVYRHQQSHVSAETKMAYIADVPLTELADRAAKEGVGLLDYFAIVRSTVIQSMLTAASVSDHSGTSTLAKRSLEVLREIGRLTGEILHSAPVSSVTNHNTTVFMASPVFMRLETMLLERLAPYPDALRSVLEGLGELDNTNAGAVIEMAALEAPYAA